MLSSERSFLVDKSVLWDTGCARRFLQIPDEERKILDNIPGWSVEEIEKSERTISVDEKGPPAPEKPESQTADTQHCNAPILNADHLAKESALNYDLPSEENSTSSEKKHGFMQSISLYANKVVHMISRRRSSSLSDIDHGKFDNGVTHSKSETNLEKSHLCSYKTFINVDKITSEKLDNRVLSHRFLKSATPSTESNPETSVFPNGTSSRNDLLSKRMELLEKRFSLPEETSLHSKEIRSKVNFGTSEEVTEESGLPKSLIPEQSSLLSHVEEMRSKLNFQATISKVTTNETNLTSVSEEQGLANQQSVSLPDLVCGSSDAVFDGTNSLSGVSSKPMDKRCAESVESHKSDSEVPLTQLNETNSVIVQDEDSLPSIEKVLETKAQEEQMQVAQTKEVLQSNHSKESCVSQNFETGNSQSCGVTSAESSILQKTSLNTPAHQVGATSALHRDHRHFSIVADIENPHSTSVLESGNAGVNNSASGKLGGKRKRQSKDNSKPRKKSLAKPPVLIHYTADEVNNMIQLMKVFQTEM